MDIQHIESRVSESSDTGEKGECRGENGGYFGLGGQQRLFSVSLALPASLSSPSVVLSYLHSL